MYVIGKQPPQYKSLVNLYARRRKLKQRHTLTEHNLVKLLRSFHRQVQIRNDFFLLCVWGRRSHS